MARSAADVPGRESRQREGISVGHDVCCAVWKVDDGICRGRCGMVGGWKLEVKRGEAAGARCWMDGPGSSLTCQATRAASSSPRPTNATPTGTLTRDMSRVNHVLPTVIEGRG